MEPVARASTARRGTWLLAVLVVVSMALVDCSGQNEPRDVETPEPPSSGDDLVYAPDVQVTAYQGEEMLGGGDIWLSQLVSRDFAQRKPIVLNFWAGLCPPCRIEMPDFQKVHDKYRDRVLLLGLDVGPFFTGLGSREDGRALLEELRITYPNGTTFDPDVVTAYSILGTPTTFFIKPTGEIVKKWAGLLNKNKMTELVEELLAASSA